MSKQAKYPNGYVETLFGSGDDAGTVTVNAKGQTLGEFRNVTHPFPVTREALEFAFAGYSYTVTDTDGKEYTLHGIDAAAASKFQHASESVRGSIRTDLLKGHDVSEELAKHRFATFLTVGGRSSSGRRAVATLSEIGDLSKEEIIALLKARGAVG